MPMYHGGHSILIFKFQDIPGLSRTFLGFFQDFHLEIPGHFQDNSKKSQKFQDIFIKFQDIHYRKSSIKPTFEYTPITHWEPDPKLHNLWGFPLIVRNLKFRTSRVYTLPYITCLLTFAKCGRYI